MATGITKRHSKDYAGQRGGRCNCNAGYEASVWSQRDGKKIRKTFPTASAARTWRADATAAIERGSLRAPTRQTLREAAQAWLEGAEAGEVRNRSASRYRLRSASDRCGKDERAARPDWLR